MSKSKVDEIIEQIEQIDEQVSIIEIYLSQQKDKISVDEINEKKNVLAKLEKTQLDLNESLCLELQDEENKPKIKSPNINNLSTGQIKYSSNINPISIFDDNHGKIDTIHRENINVNVEKKNPVIDHNKISTIYEPSGATVYYNKDSFDHSICYLQLLTYKPKPNQGFFF